MRGMLRHLVVAGTLTFACSGPRPGDGRTQEFKAQFARVRSARAELVAARKALDRAGSGGAAPDAGALRRAQAAFEAAYTRDQKLLAAFLNVALNERPSSPQTREALTLYTEGAVENARYFLDWAGDGRRAVEVLEAAERCYPMLGLPIPADLSTTLAQARRFQATPPTPSPNAVSRPKPRSHR
jgi:hypothetical protein